MFSGVRVLLFGGVSVGNGGDDAAAVTVLSGSRQRAVLACLAREHGRSVSVDRLLEDVWGDDQPASGPRALAFQVSKLRDLLEPARDGAGTIIVNDKAGYRLEIDADAIDLFRFERLVATARQTVETDSGAGLAMLREALELWRGQPYDGLDDLAWTGAEIERLDRLRLLAERTVARGLIDTGDTEDAVTLLDMLVERNPFDEDLVADHMQALGAVGRRSDALSAFGALRLRLSTELGIDPSRRLQEIETRLLESGSGPAPASASVSLAAPEEAASPEPILANRPVGVGLPARLERDTVLDLAGRAAELDTLRQALKEAAAGTPRMVLLAGEPGIGKTRLCTELSIAAHKQGATVLFGRCDQDHGVAHQPWVEAVTHLLGFNYGPATSAALETHASTLGLLGPAVRDVLSDAANAATSDAETDRYRLALAVTSVVRALAEDTPLVLVFDDLHWSDAETLTLLRQTFANLDHAPVLVLGTYRDSDLGPGHPLIDTMASLRREPGFQQLSLAGLDDTEMLELVTISAVGNEISDEAREVAMDLRHETAGNPFFAHEILRHLVEIGDIYLDASDQVWKVRAARDELGLPQSVRDVVGQRVSRLDREAQKLLRVAAVIGFEFDIDVLAEVTDSNDDDVIDLLDEAIEARVVAEVPDATGTERYRFRHALARSALLAELSSGRRRRMHRNVAEVFEALSPADPELRTAERIAELATHWLAASVPVDATKAVEYARQAGRQALASMAPAEATRWFSTALDQLVDGVDLAGGPDQAAMRVRAEVTVDLGVAQRQAGDSAYRTTLLEAASLAIELDATDLKVASALANNRGNYSRLGQVDHERVAALRSALDAVGDKPTGDRALLLGTLFSELEYGSTYPERVGLMTEAIAVARLLDDDVTLASVLNRACVTSAVPENLEFRLDAADESLAIARRVGDKTLEFWALCGSTLAGLGAADPDRVAAGLDGMNAVAAETGRPQFEWLARNVSCSALSAFGDPDEMERLGTANLDLGLEIGQPDAFDFYMVIMMTARWGQGRSGEIIEAHLKIAAENPSIEAYRAAAAYFLSTELDRPDEAADLLAEARDSGFDADLTNPWAATTCNWARTAAALGDTESCALLYEQLLPFTGQISCHLTFCDASIDGVLGLLATALGRLDDAERHLAGAQVVTDRFGAGFFTALDDLSRAGLARAHADAAAERRWLERAAATANEQGYAAITARAAVALAALD